jgi:hypothetical protein
MTHRRDEIRQPYAQALISPSSIASRLAAVNLAWNSSKRSKIRHFRRVSDTTKPVSRFSAAASPRATSPDKDGEDLQALLQLISPRSGLAPAARPEASVRNERLLEGHVEKRQGYLKAPRIYSNQVFRDVYDSQGHHDKELYTEDFLAVPNRDEKISALKRNAAALELRRKQSACRRHSASEAPS